MSSGAASAMRCAGLSVNVAGRTLVRGLDLDLCAGEIVALLGRNGSGKSLTLHTLAGLRPATAGRVELKGHAMQHERQYVAQHLALLPQYTEDTFPASVLDTAMIGRHPHIGRWRWESARDRRIALAALAQMDLDGMAARDVATLSGGERRRLAIAQVLTQTPRVFLLDEPTNHLDPQHQLQVLQVFTQQARNGAAILVSLHDVNLAARFADRCLLLFGDGRWDLDDTAAALTERRLSELYNTPMEALSWRGKQIFMAGTQP